MKIGNWHFGWKVTRNYSFSPLKINRKSIFVCLGMKEMRFQPLRMKVSWWKTIFNFKFKTNQSINHLFIPLRIFVHQLSVYCLNWEIIVSDLSKILSKTVKTINLWNRKTTLKQFGSLFDVVTKQIFLYYLKIFMTKTISRTDEGQTRPKYIFNKMWN